MKTLNNKLDYKNLLNEIETLAMTPTFVVEAAKLAPKLEFTQKDWDIEKPYILYYLAKEVIFNKYN